MRWTFSAKSCEHTLPQAHGDTPSSDALWSTSTSGGVCELTPVSQGNLTLCAAKSWIIPGEYKWKGKRENPCTHLAEKPCCNYGDEDDKSWGLEKGGRNKVTAGKVKFELMFQVSTLQKLGMILFILKSISLLHLWGTGVWTRPSDWRLKDVSAAARRGSITRTASQRTCIAAIIAHLSQERAIC